MVRLPWHLCTLAFDDHRSEDWHHMRRELLDILRHTNQHDRSAMMISGLHQALHNDLGPLEWRGFGCYWVLFELIIQPGKGTNPHFACGFSNAHKGHIWQINSRSKKHRSAAAWAVSRALEAMPTSDSLSPGRCGRAADALACSCPSLAPAKFSSETRGNHKQYHHALRDEFRMQKKMSISHPGIVTEWGILSHRSTHVTRH